MSTVAKLRGVDFDTMAEQGAFNSLEPMKIELIHGELRFMNPAGPIHDGEIDYLTRWSCDNTDRDKIVVRVQCGIQCGNHRPEPDLVWFRKQTSRRIRPTERDVLLLIEISDSSLTPDLIEKAELYAQHAVMEYWIVDINSARIHVHRRPENGQYNSIEIYRSPTVITPLCQPTAELSLTELFDFDS